MGAYPPEIKAMSRWREQQRQAEANAQRANLGMSPLGESSTERHHREWAEGVRAHRQALRRECEYCGSTESIKDHGNGKKCANCGAS